MNLTDIAYKNLMRRKAKAVFILAGLVIGVSTIIAIVGFVEAMTSDINTKLEKYGANILIVPRTENLSLTYGGISLGGVSFDMNEIHEKELLRVRSIKNAANVAAVGPLVLGVIQIQNRRILLSGIDFQSVKILKPWWQLNGKIPDENSVLLGAEIARILALDLGSTLEIKGRKFAVTGILNPTGSQDDQLVFTPLATAQRLLGKEGRISMAEVAALCTDCPITEMVRQIAAALPGAKVMAIQQVVKGRMETMAQMKQFSYGVSAVILLVGSLVVLVTMMGSVRERTVEIGIFRAIGFRKRHVVHIVLLEAFVISGLAGIIGYIFGLGATKLIVRLVAEGKSVGVPLNLELAAGAIIVAILVGLASSIYPAIMAARLDPNDALRAL